MITYLEEKGIHTLIHYPKAIHLQGAYQELGFKEGDYPLAEKICATEISIPLFPGMTEDETQYVIECINRFSLNLLHILHFLIPNPHFSN